MARIIVTAGHGGGDPGAIGVNGLREADLAVSVRNAVVMDLDAVFAHKAETDGWKTENRALREVLRMFRGGEVAVEIHFNAGPPTATGVEALATPDNKAFAQRLAKSVSVATGLKLRGEDGWKNDTSGQHPRLAFCRAGGVILEVGFITNAQDVAAIQGSSSQMALNIAAAINAEADIIDIIDMR